MCVLYQFGVFELWNQFHLEDPLFPIENGYFEIMDLDI